MTTLRKLHEELNITQRLSLYVKNQNKKYKPNEPFTADDELSKTMETLIRINTLGKLGRHMEQARVMSKATGAVKRDNFTMAGLISEKAALEVKLKEATNKAERAEKIVNNANMRDYIIKLYRVAAEVDSQTTFDEYTKEQSELLEKYAQKAAKFITKQQFRFILNEEAGKLAKYLQQKEGK